MAEAAPTCPACGKPMRKRKSAKGEFLGCTGYPACRATRE
jgi:ssDNA-binding Zn-finger/Zn-ribbon topoisomerase 1